MQSEFPQKAVRCAAQAVPVLCALFMLCAVPLLFHDAFFDINRVKVNAVNAVVPVLLLCFGAASLLNRGGAEKSGAGRGAQAAMAVFLAACVVSCALTGFDRTTLDGSEGRYCGLHFMLCCGAAFYMIARCSPAHMRRVLPAVLLCAAACALLGVLNAMGVDPLGFYTRIRRDQRTVFLSTIGHFDFFGTYLTIVFPLAGGLYVFGEERAERALGFACAACMALGAMASRTDSALAALHLGCFMLLALSGADWRCMARALLLWAVGFAALSLMGLLLRFSAFRPPVSGLPGMLIRLHVGEAAAALLAIGAALCCRFGRLRMRVPGRNRLLMILLAAFLAAAVAALLLVIWFSFVDPAADLGSAAAFLRFNDEWGTLRGFAWIRSVRAFRDFSPVQKLFGAGMERTLQVLSPYFDDPAMLAYGVFNDPHCQPLQMLLTCGLFGMTAFFALYAAALVSFVRRAKGNPLLCGAAASLWAYGVIMMINVTQPILIATYFSVCALGVGALGNQANTKGGEMA